ncbi:MAG TPA: hypothetical protein VGI40_16560 [Pirellulaceae bacterium]
MPSRLVAVAAFLLTSGWQIGFAQIRIPAIDPTGQRLFSGTTTLSCDALKDGLLHKKAQPAAAVAPAVPIVAPPVKPPCLPSVEAVPLVPVVPVPVVAVPQNPLPAVPVIPAVCGPKQMQPQIIPVAAPAAVEPCDDARGPQLSVTPSRIVAPVNTEVVMVAGLCGPDGYLITRQPLEWMLAQDGVGQIVAVGHESPHNSSLILRGSPHKIATNYARAHTSTISQVINRGTPTPTDDVYLQKGQSWISVTSPTEGQTHVIVWTPKEQNWNYRKATATIYWVDASWRLPPSATARSGQPYPLTTVLTRSNGDPITGWIVRYEVVEGPPAAFGRGLTAIEVPSDAAGRAIANLLPTSPEAGITTVRVQIIRPSTRIGESQMIVGQGTVGVQWTTPGLSMRAIGTSNALADGAIGYRVELTNGGDLATHNVTLSYTPPTGVSVLNSTPAAQVFGQRLEWRLGNLPPGSTSVVELNCRAAVAGSIRSSFVATSAEVPRVENQVLTNVRTNALVVKMTGPESVEVGREAKFLVDVTNTGPTALMNVTATDTFDPGLSHAGGERSPLVRPITIIQPGQTERFALSFIVAQPGRHCHRLDVMADGGQAAGARACVTGTSAVVTPPQISVRVNGPPSRRAGEVASFAVEIKNNGSAPATNVVLAINWAANMELTEASQGHEDNIPRLTTQWRVAQLNGGETQVRQLNFMCLRDDPQGAVVRATVRSDQTGPVGNQASTIISPGASAPQRVQQPQSAAPLRPDATIPPAAAGSGALKITATAQANPIALGMTTTLLIFVTNERTVADRDVALSVQALDDGVTLRVAGTSPTPVAASSAAAIDFSAIREMRPGEQLASPFRIEVRGMKAGTHRIRVNATSGLNPAGTATETEVVVNPQ